MLIENLEVLSNPMTVKDPCPVCTAKDAKYLFPVKSGQLIQCNNCQLIYFTPQPSPQELEDFYNSEDYRNEFSESLMSGAEFATNRYLQFESALKKYAPQVLTQSSRKLLDVGCGTGDFLKVAQGQGWQVSGTEISANAAQKVSSRINGIVYVGDLNSINFANQKYDVITAYHVIEHLLDPVSFLKQIEKILEPSGIVFLETPNIGGIGFKISREKWSHLIPPEHIIYFKPVSLSFALKQSGFRDIKAYTIAPQIIASLNRYPSTIQNLGRLIYQASCAFNLGPTLQAIASPSRR